MAVIALHSASTGLSALGTELDVIANNLANVNTVGFKSSRVNFQDLMYIQRKQPGAENTNGDERPMGLFVGLGTQVSGTQKSFSTGPAEVTNEPLDIFIEGAGFLQVAVGADEAPGGIAYTRNGSMAINSEGQLVTASDPGRVIQPPITIPEDAQTITIMSNGEVFVTLSGEAEPQSVGQIELAAFINPAGLEDLGGNLYAETKASGTPTTGIPSEGVFGSILQGVLEGSNVDPVRELVSLIKTQRAFELNSQTIKAADETLQQVSNLRR